MQVRDTARVSENEINVVWLKYTTLQKDQNNQTVDLQSIGTDQPLLILDRKVEVLGDGEHSNSHRGTRNYKTQVYNVLFVVSWLLAQSQVFFLLTLY